MLLEPSIHSKLSFCFAFIYSVSLVNAQHEEEHAVDPMSSEFWGQIVAIFFLVCLSGIVAGTFVLSVPIKFLGNNLTIYYIFARSYSRLGKYV
jgi:hypothetical protein